MGYGAASAPTIQTGNPQWDRNLGGLAHIFGTPGGYERGLAAGAQARESLLKGDASITERNAAILLARSLQQMDQTGAPVMPQQPTYRQSGVVGGAPIMEQPGGLQTSAGQPTPPPLQAQAPSRSLWDMITGQNRQQPTPPAASPAPNAGAPAAPNTTGSDGSVPANSGPPDRTFNTTGGGQHYAPAANPDGSPRPPPLNLATYMGLATLAGQNPQMAQQTLSAIIAGGFEHGIIPWHTANSAMGGQGQSATQLAALIGNNAPYQSVQGTIQNAATNATTIQRENIQQGAETARNTARIAGENYRFGETAQQGLVTRDENGMPVVNLPGLTPGAPVRPVGPGFNQSLADQENAQVMVYQKRPDGTIDYVSPPVRVSARQARLQGLPIFTEGQKGAGAEPSPGSDEAIARSIYVEDNFKRAYAPGNATVGGQTTLDAKPTLSSQSAVADYAEFLREQSRGTMTTDQAYNMAQQELQQQGFLPTKEQTDDARNAYYYQFADNPAVTKNAKGDFTGWSIPLLKPYVSPRGNGHVISADANQTGGIRHAERVDTASMRPTMPSVPTRPAAVPPGGAGAARQSTSGQLLGNAPPGTPNGFMTDASGRKIEVRDGKVYSAQ